MNRAIRVILMGFSIIILAIFAVVAIMVGLYYKRIYDFTPVSRSFYGTIMDEYEGIWARNYDDCNTSADKSNRTLINTNDGFSRFKNFRFQCDLIRFPKKEDPAQVIQLGCWKVLGRSIADGGSKTVRDIVILDRNTVAIGRDLFTHCNP